MPLPRPPPAPPNEIVVSRVIDAPRELVFHAFMAACEPWVRGGPREIDAPERVVYGDGAPLTVTFVAHARRTTVTVRAAGAPAERDWGAALERLAATIAAV